jgi:serine/threonine protein phosphatase PrpC
MRPGDSMLACSDGVWHYFSDKELGSVLSTLSARDASEFLVSKAHSRGRGHGDNMSLIILKFEPL